MCTLQLGFVVCVTVELGRLSVNWYVHTHPVSLPWWGWGGSVWLHCQWRCPLSKVPLLWGHLLVLDMHVLFFLHHNHSVYFTIVPLCVWDRLSSPCLKWLHHITSLKWQAGRPHRELKLNKVRTFTWKATCACTCTCRLWLCALFPRVVWRLWRLFRLHFQVGLGLHGSYMTRLIKAVCVSKFLGVTIVSCTHTRYWHYYMAIWLESWY